MVHLLPVSLTQQPPTYAAPWCLLRPLSPGYTEAIKSSRLALCVTGAAILRRLRSGRSRLCAKTDGKELRPPPDAPGAVPIVGHLPLIGLGELGVPGTKPPHLVMGQIGKTYGDVVGLRFGMAKMVLLSSPEAVQEALVDQCSAAAGRPPLASMSANGLDTGLSGSKPDEAWRALRAALLAEAYAPAAVRRAEPMIREEALRLRGKLTDLAQEPVKIRPFLRRAVSELLLRWALSLQHDDPATKELVAMIEEGWSTLTATTTTALDFVLPAAVAASPAGRRLRRLRQRRATLLHAMVAGRRRSPPRASPDFLDALLEAQKENKDILGDDLVVNTLVSLTTAGISTVSTALEWLLLLLGHDPEKQRLARSDVLGQGPEGYLQACIQETLRFRTPLFIPRLCLDKVKVGDFEVPAGNYLLPDSYALAHDPALWGGGSPSEFRPERWLQEEKWLLGQLPSARPRTNGCPVAEHSAACKFVPFGVGARFCPGAGLALAEIRAFATAILEDLEWSVTADGDLSESYSLTLSPKKPGRIQFHQCPRSSN